MSDTGAPSAEPDQYLVERIRTALAEDPRVNELELEVDVSGGTVVISGTVATPERQAAIPEVVRAVAPDCDVVNGTRVVRLARTLPEEPVR